MAAEDRLLNNGVSCPSRTLDRQSNKDGSGPAVVVLGPVSNTAIRHITISALDHRFNEDDGSPAMVRMEVTVFYTDLRCPTMMRLETSIH